MRFNLICLGLMVACMCWIVLAVAQGWSWWAPVVLAITFGGLGTRALS